MTRTFCVWRLPSTPRTKSMCRCRSFTASLHQPRRRAAPSARRRRRPERLPAFFDRCTESIVPGPVAADGAGDLIDLQRLELQLLPDVTPRDVALVELGEGAFPAFELRQLRLLPAAAVEPHRRRRSAPRAVACAASPACFTCTSPRNVSRDRRSCIDSCQVMVSGCGLRRAACPPCRGRPASSPRRAS